MKTRNRTILAVSLLTAALSCGGAVVAGEPALAADLGVTGLADGGGIFNTQFGGGPPELVLSHSVVTANRLKTTTAITPRGGGIYTADFLGNPFPITLTRTVVAATSPTNASAANDEARHQTSPHGVRSALGEQNAGSATHHAAYVPAVP